MPESDPARTAASTPAEASVDGSVNETAALAPAAGGRAGDAFGLPQAPGEVGTLGPYRVVKELGHGGMGAVYLAVDTRLARKVALKVMLPAFAADSAAKERFLREARAAARVEHDNVVTVYEADERAGVPYIAMQLLQGYPLDDYLKRKGNLSVPQVLRVARETALGLAAAHARGLVHRDIKPANLWLEAPHGRVKVLDFGLARPVGTDSELTGCAVVGTPAYMSPEQARGQAVDHRTDLFSLGAVMYRLCTGRNPFPGSTVMAVLMSLGRQDPTPVRELNPAVPEALAALVHRLLAKDPADRPQTAAEVARVLREIAASPAASDVPMAAAVPDPGAPTPSQAPAVSVPIQVTIQSENAFDHLDDTEAEAKKAKAPKEARRKAGGKGLWLAAGAAVLLAAVIVAVVIALTRTTGPEAKPGAAGEPAPAPKGKPPGKDAPTADPDRRAAAYVLSIGGGVGVNDEEGDLRAAIDLPRGAFHLTRVNLQDNAHTTDAGLANFKDCKHITLLQLSGTQPGDAALANFKDCTGLKYLYLNKTWVGDAGLAHFKNCKNLVHIGLSDARATDAGLADFGDCKNLTELGLFGTKLTDKGLARFAGCRELVWVNLGSTQVTDAGLTQQLKNWKELQTLHLWNTEAGDGCLVPLAECKSLRFLGLQQTKVTAAGVEALARALPQCRIEWDGGVIDPAKK